jgi:ectoine hydroxylase-related dioxygenase (phytanoyl-CoA dioxygenase family)
MSHKNAAVLDQTQIDQFARDGYLILKGFYDPEDVAQVCKGIYAVIGQVMQRHGVVDSRQEFSTEAFDVGYTDLIRADRRLGSEVYDAVKYIPAFWRIVAHPANAAWITQLRPNSVPALAAAGCGIRIDNPAEDKFRALWHQEYPAQLRSLDGLVFWSPLVPITESSGPVALCAGSHKEGALPVLRLDSSTSGRSGAYALQLANEQNLIAKYPQNSPLTNPGDLILMDFLTLHASGFNRSERSRWSMQFRYFNMAESTGQAHGWKGSYADGVDFASIHPELIV